MLYDVLTWVVHGGELNVLIIIIHGMLMLHVALTYIHVRKHVGVSAWLESTLCRCSMECHAYTVVDQHCVWC